MTFKIFCYSAENIKWTGLQSNPPVKIKPFKDYDSAYGPTFQATSVLGIFRLFFTTQLATTIVAETNRYAKLCLSVAQFEKWEEMTEEELFAYFGFLMLMGIVNMPSIRDYW